MNRRRFVKEAAITVGVSAPLFGWHLFQRREQARKDLATHLLASAQPLLSEQADTQVRNLPTRAAAGVRSFFDGKCLNSASFVNYLCSSGFARLVRGQPDAAREAIVFAAFCEQVTTEAEICGRIDALAADVGRELDLGWARYAGTVAGTWNARLKPCDETLTERFVCGEMTELVRRELATAHALSVSASRTPALAETVGAIGKTAVMLMPAARFKKAGVLVAVPVFILVAIGEVWRYVVGQPEPRRAGLQAALSGRMANLGERAAGLLEREVRRRIQILHGWQQQALNETAIRLANERVILW